MNVEHNPTFILLRRRRIRKQIHMGTWALTPSLSRSANNLAQGYSKLNYFFYCSFFFFYRSYWFFWLYYATKFYLFASYQWILIYHTIFHFISNSFFFYKQTCMYLIFIFSSRHKQNISKDKIDILIWFKKFISLLF